MKGIFILSITLLAGCVSPKISSVATAPSAQAVRVIALAPGGGILADAVGGELANRGFQIIDPASTSRLLGRVNLNEFEITRPESIVKLREQGVDAILTVRAAGGYDQQPQSASARITSTYTGQLISAVSWQNGWGGMAGSIADRQMRSGLIEAASQIATGVAANVRQERDAPLQTIVATPAPMIAPAHSDARANKFGYAAEKFAREQRCASPTPPTLVATGPGFETFSVACSVGDPMIVRCEFGNCRALR